MLRPARVAMRWRNPWFLARLRVFGWYVRFTAIDPCLGAGCAIGAPRIVRRAACARQGCKP